MSVIVTAVFQPVDGARDRLLAALAVATAEVHQEEGCEFYALHAADDGTVWFLEKWTNDEALDAHAVGGPIGRLNASIEGLVTAPPVVTRMRAIPAGTTAQGIL